MLLNLQQQYQKLDSKDLNELQIPNLSGQIEQLGKYLPPAITEGCLEIELTGPENLALHRKVDRRCDLWATLPSDQGAREVCHQYLGEDAITAVAPLCWAGAYRLLWEWSDPRSELADGLGDLFFEFDTASNAEVTPIVIAAFGNKLTPESACSIIALYYQLLAEKTLPEGVKRQIDSVCYALPRSGFLRHVALMCGREPMALRLVLTLRLLSVVGVLETLAWQGPLDEVNDLLRALIKTTPLLGVQLDAGDTATGKIGLEIAVSGTPEPSQHRVIFDYLEANGLCGNAMRILLERWLKQQPRDGHRSLIIKVTFSMTHDASAKGYLVFS